MKIKPAKWGGANATTAKLRGARTIVILQMLFSLARNIIELIDFLKLGGSGMLPQENF